jgi:predicted DNA-binding protein
MATMTRRLQVLLDEERMNRLERYAGERGTSVAVLVREAIDTVFADPDASQRQAAMRRFLDAPPLPVPDDWDEMKGPAHEDYYGGHM